MKTGDLIMLGVVAVGGYLIYTNWGSISGALSPAVGTAQIPSSPGGIQPAGSAASLVTQTVVPSNTPPSTSIGTPPTTGAYPNLGNGPVVQQAIANGWTQTLSVLNSIVPAKISQDTAIGQLSWWMAQPMIHSDAEIAADAKAEGGLSGYRRYVGYRRARFA